MSKQKRRDQDRDWTWQPGDLRPTDGAKLLPEHVRDERADNGCMIHRTVRSTPPRERE